MIVVGLLIGLIGFILPIAIIVFIVSAIMKRNKEDKNSLEETVRNIYIYIILIVTLVAIIGGVISAFRIGLDIILPEKSTYQDLSYNREEREKNSNMIEMITDISLVISAIPVFIYHNKLAKSNKVIKETIIE